MRVHVNALEYIYWRVVARAFASLLLELFKIQHVQVHIVGPSIPPAPPGWNGSKKCRITHMLTN